MDAGSDVVDELADEEALRTEVDETGSSIESPFSAHGASVSFQGLVALDDVSVSLRREEILGLIGPNGAGKTTLINAMSGFQPMDAGRVVLKGNDVTHWPPHRIARHGVARTYQAARLYPRLSVFENVRASGVCHGMTPREAAGRASDLLSFFGLDHLADASVSRLTHGHQRVLTVARAIVAYPDFLLLDEPAAGLNEVESNLLVDHLRTVRAEIGCGILIIEHDMRVIMELCDAVQVLDHGATLALGTPEELQTNQAVIDAYLGSVDSS